MLDDWDEAIGTITFGEDRRCLACVDKLREGGASRNKVGPRSDICFHLSGSHTCLLKQHRAQLRLADAGRSINLIYLNSMFNEVELRRFDLNLLLVFTALISERSASLAAQKLGLGAPAVSMALKRLRAELNDPLFVRVGTEFKPTSRATEFMRAIEPGLERIYSGIKGGSQFDPASTHRTFRVGCSDDIDVILSPLLARSALASRESSRFVIRRTDFHTSPILLERDEIDLAVGVVKDLPKWLNSKLVSAQGLLCLVDPSHVDTRKKLSMQAYLDIPHVIVSFAGDLRGVLDETLSALRVRRYVAHSTPYFSVVPSILKEGRAIATLPSYVVREFARTHGLSILKPPCDFGKFDIHIVWHRKNEKDAGHQWLRSNVSAGLADVLRKQAATE